MTPGLAGNLSLFWNSSKADPPGRDEKMGWDDPPRGRTSKIVSFDVVKKPEVAIPRNLAGAGVVAVPDATLLFAICRAPGTTLLGCGTWRPVPKPPASRSIPRSIA